MKQKRRKNPFRRREIWDADGQLHFDSHASAAAPAAPRAASTSLPETLPEAPGVPATGGAATRLHPATSLPHPEVPWPNDLEPLAAGGPPPLVEPRRRALVIPFRNRMHPRRIPLRVWMVAGASVLASGGVIAWEMHTATLQSHWFSRYARRLTWTVGSGPCPDPVRSQLGPYDVRLGYSRLGEMQTALAERGFVVTQQACPSPALATLVSRGIAAPYPEKDGARLLILDSGGNDLYRAVGDAFQFQTYGELPPLVVQSLLYIENRQLLDEGRTRLNPAVEWDRLFLAGGRYAFEKVLRTGYVIGGSTLATQIEKFRHSPAGRTSGAGDKLRQMVSASLRAYRKGPDTRVTRHDIVVNYMNTMPLGAAPGEGEVNGLAQGMRAWFGKSPLDLQRDLALPEDGPDLERKAETYKQSLALVLATRRPNVYLLQRRDLLERRLESYVGLMAQEGLITPQLAEATRRAPLDFLTSAPPRPSAAFVDRKATNAVRTQLLDMLDVPSLYDLDRYDLRVETGIDASAQEKVTSVLRQLSNRDFLAANGFYGEHLLGGADPSRIIYGFSLYESTPRGNCMRVQADNLDGPLDFNRNVKLELGSTAKLRTMANYLMVMASLHERYRQQPPLRADAETASDPITRWAVRWARRNPMSGLDEMLEASLERYLSASSDEVFFTGEGRHTFRNFDDKFSEPMPLRTAFQNSVNLVYIRLMRELTQYYTAQLGYDVRVIMNHVDSPVRKELLDAALDHEARAHLMVAYRKYDDMSYDEALRKLCGDDDRTLRRLAIFYLTEHPGADLAAYATEARRLFPARVSATSEADLASYYEAYSGRIENSQDEAWLLDRNPLEIWRVRDLRRHPHSNWNELVENSREARRESSAWIYKSRLKQAQDSRIRSELERRAFVEIHKAWKTLGYPFATLVPSLATAIGSSADRPEALAELVGIIQNDGVRTPFMPVGALHFAEGTPYETRFEPNKGLDGRVMPAEVAQALKALMLQVVEKGTAHRVQGALVDAANEPIPIGGKTGSGDNRYEKFASNGTLLSSRAVNRTASFVFVIGDRYFGMMSAYVAGEEAGRYHFTSALALQAFKTLAPALEPLVAGVEARAVPGQQGPSDPATGAARADRPKPAPVPIAVVAPSEH